MKEMRLRFLAGQNVRSAGDTVRVVDESGDEYFYFENDTLLRCAVSKSGDGEVFDVVAVERTMEEDIDLLLELLDLYGFK